MRFLVLFDTPSIKQYVFGTDPLREIRGASANLDRLNRLETGSKLEKNLPQTATVDPVYANGGSAQFVVQGADEASVRQACDAVVAYFMKETAGDVKPVYGVAPLEQDQTYPLAVQQAFFELRSRREMTAVVRTPPLLPFMAECASASHLPAVRFVTVGNQRRALSESSLIKEKCGRLAREHGIWAQWMKTLSQQGPWPPLEDWDQLRCETLEQIGEHAQGRLKGDIGLVYADGNAMGQVVQQLDHVDACRAFSRIVDESIRQACFQALEQVCAPEVKKIRKTNGSSPCRLPADILLLGGDDLLVVVPADRALEFARQVAERFAQLTHEKIQQENNPQAQEFFQRLGISRFTISCGVAVARANYPFYLLLELAEELLKSAKRGSPVLAAEQAAESHVDFHVVAGANSFSLAQTRQEDYLSDSPCPRTLRPLDLSQLTSLHQAVCLLRKKEFPRSKLHALHEAALLTSPCQAERSIRHLFARCKPAQRTALVEALKKLCPRNWALDPETFPMFQRGNERVLAVADLVEAYDLLGTARTGNSNGKKAPCNDST